MKGTSIKICTLIITALFVTNCKEKKDSPIEPSKETITRASKKLNNWFQKQWDIELSFSPMDRTYLGDKTDYDKWDDISQEAQEKKLVRTKMALSYLKDSVTLNTLDTATKLSYKLAFQKAENEIADYKYRLHNYPVNQMFGMHAQVPAFLINMHQITNKKDAEAYISRLKGVPEIFNQLIENLKEREIAGIMPPKYIFPKVIESCENIIKGAPYDNSKKNNTLLDDFTKKVAKLDLDSEEEKALITSAEIALKTAIKPAYIKLTTFLKEQEKNTTNDDGAWKLPEGEAFYNNALARTTTTNMTANEIHDLGLSEVTRIHSEMEIIKENVGFKGTLQEFFTFMKEDKQFCYPDSKEGREAYMNKAVKIIDSMKGRLDELFITKPKADIIVKQVEAFREKAAGLAFYQAPALDGSRPGIYYANMYDIKSMPTYQMEALAYHEGIPGHHMQIAISQELENVPMFRKMGRYTAYTEGWGLYTELIPKEIGFYSDPYSDFGRLAMELWRACRLVVDTGIHTKKWNREKSIKYYTDNTPNTEYDAIRMVERHVVMPSQATAYKIGMNKILSLRENAKKQLGEKFNIREYHDVILTNGPLPLNVLEDNVQEWIENK